MKISEPKYTQGKKITEITYPSKQNNLDKGSLRMAIDILGIVHMYDWEHSVKNGFIFFHELSRSLFCQAFHFPAIFCHFHVKRNIVACWLNS